MKILYALLAGLKIHWSDPQQRNSSPAPKHTKKKKKKKKKRRCPRYDTKLHLMMRPQVWTTGECGAPFLLPLLPGPLWPTMLVSVRVPSMGQIDLFKKLIVLKKIFKIYEKETITQ